MHVLLIMIRALCKTLHTLSTKMLTDPTEVKRLPTADKFLGLVDLEMLRYPPNKLHELFGKRRRKLGDMYILSPSVFGKNSVVISTPALVSELVSKEGRFPVRRTEGSWFNRAKRAVGLKPGLLSSGKQWKQLRAPLSKRFLKPKSLSEYLPRLSGIAANAVRNITELNEGSNHTAKELCLWTINSAYYLLFHTERDKEMTEDLTEFINAVLIISRSSLGYKWYDVRKYFPSKEWDRLIDSFRTVISFTEEQINMSRDRSICTDISQLPLLGYLQNETEFDYVDILDSFITFLAASMDATVISTQWLWYNLSKSPTAQDRVCEEVHSVVGDSPIITTEHYNKLHYIKWCMKESMRLTPTATMFSRVLQEDCTLGGVSMARGAHVLADLYGMGQDERYWREPREFLPDRWKNRSDIDPFSYIPFGVGPRMCIGRRLAEVEMQLITAQLCRDYRLHLLQEPESSLEVMVVPRGLQLSFEKR